MKVEIYIEGGGNNNKDLKTRCRIGFRQFFERAGFPGQRLTPIACGSRNETFKRFCTAIEKAEPDVFPMLLVDSERPVHPSDQGKPWSHLTKPPDNWRRPQGSTDRNAHLMVECMEAWFLADHDHLARYFGQGFNRHALPKRTDIELVPKKQVLDALDNASRPCVGKGRYSKGKHSFALLAGLDHRNVEAASPFAKRFFEMLRETCGP